jgi:DNA-binding GntR family transcriptional regulator
VGKVTGQEMTQDEIIEMARQVGIKYRGFGDEFYSPQSDGVEIEQMEALVKLVEAKEREACAKVCEDSVEYAGDTLAELIRARGEA